MLHFGGDESDLSKIVWHLFGTGDELETGQKRESEMRT